jgi:aldose sugar dehydrogenase
LRGTRDDQIPDRIRMKSPVVIVTAALTVAILLTASFLIATGTRGENALTRVPAGPVVIAPVAK